VDAAIDKLIGLEQTCVENRSCACLEEKAPQAGGTILAALFSRILPPFSCRRDGRRS
jgi:hypothetical protein